MANWIVTILVLVQVLFICSSTGWFISFSRRRSNPKPQPSGGSVVGGGGTAAPNKGNPSPGAQQACLDQHNVYRRRHGVAPLAWDSRLAQDSQNWANYLVRLGGLKHSSGNYGENLAFAYDSRGVKNLGKEAVVRWYDEICLYHGCGFSSGTGHFTQVVWASSKYVGCAIAKSRDGKVFTVARYTPAGNMNMPGYFKKNVGCGNSAIIEKNRNKVNCR